MHHVSHSFLVKHPITQVTQPPYSPDLVPCNFWLFPKLKSPLKGKRFQTISEIQENTMGQLMAIGRTVWGPRVSTLKGTEAPLSYVQCFLCLVSSPINVSIFHITCLDTFLIDLVFTMPRTRVTSSQYLMNIRMYETMGLTLMFTYSERSTFLFLWKVSAS